MVGGTTTGTPKHCNKGSSSGTTDQCSKRQRSGAKVQIYDDTVHIRVRHNTFSCSPDSDPFHVSMDCPSFFSCKNLGLGTEMHMQKIFKFM